jgi:hypothetical protein
MQIINLYKYHRADGGVTVSPIKPYGSSYVTMFRLIADEGMILTDGSTNTTCVDTHNINQWQEVVDEAVEGEIVEEISEIY